MNITFNDVDRKSHESFLNVTGYTNSNIDSVNSHKGNEKNYSLDISSRVTDNAYRGQGKTMKEVIKSIEATDIDAYRDYMAVMSNCVSDEDFARMQKEGFNPGTTEFDETVTIVDHIKAAMIKGGADIKGYTDDISDEALEKITGSKTYANALKKSFSEKDIPLTETNAKEVTSGYEELKEIKPLTDSGIKYMTENDLDITVSNLYTASFSAGNDSFRQGRGYYMAGDVAGYYAKKPENIDIESLKPQMAKVVEEAGYKVSEENLKEASYLVEKGIPLTKETFGRLMELKSLSLPMEFDLFADKATNAILDGITVKDYPLTRNKSLRQEAYDIYKEVNTEGTIKGRRVLEEVRLSMTVEANLKLLRSGFSIDTAPMEDLIKNLKEIEKEFAINLTHDEDEIEAVRKKDIFDTATFLIDNIKNAPISISFAYESTETLQVVSDKADSLRLELDKANERYEKFMTAPRADLGDSIRKAFANVDEILTGMGEALTEENERAVRILGYNSIEITEENLSRIKEKDKLLHRTINELTPGRVLGMIRDNKNPITMPIEELDKYLRDQDTTKDDLLSYSKFLYKLEKSKDITEDEREAYIGIYRLINQIEKGDFSSVGAISEINAEFNLENLLSMVRTGKHKRMDLKVDDSFGGMDAVDKGIKSITSQIAKGFIEDTADLKRLLEETGSKEAEREFEKEEASIIRNAYKAEAEVLEALNRTSTPVTAENIMNMSEMMKKPGDVFKKLKDIGYKKEIKIGTDSKEEAQKSTEEFTGSVKEFIEKEVFGTSTDHLALKAMDLRAIRSIYTQMDFISSQAESENYTVPTLIAGEEIAINLTISHSGTEQMAHISFETASYGKVEGKIVPKDKGLSGTYSCTSNEGLELLNNFKDSLKEALDRINDTDVVSTNRYYKASKAFIEYVQNAFGSK